MEVVYGVMADGTGYKRQGAESMRGELRLVMGVRKGRLVPLGAWADKSWEDINKEILAEKPKDIQPPVVVIDGEPGQEVLGNLAEDIQRCQWHLPRQAISLLERVMREMGRRIKKIGAAWKEKGVLAVARVLLTRIYDPKRWRKYWEKLLDLDGRCVVQDVSLSFAVS